MKRFWKILATGIFLALLPVIASAQQVNNYWQTGTGSSGWHAVTTAEPFPVQVVGGGGGGLSVTDNSAWTNNLSNFTPNGGVFNDSATVLSSGNQGTVRLNTHREMHVDIDANAGTNNFYSVLTAPTPLISRTSELGTPIATGSPVPAAADSVGKIITSPYANRENMVRGTASTTAGTATTLLAASGSASLKTYVTDLNCGRTDAGTTAIFITFNDVEGTGSGHILVLPNNGGGGGNNLPIDVPLVTAANTAFTYTVSTGTTTVYCNARGFTGY